MNDKARAQTGRRPLTHIAAQICEAPLPERRRAAVHWLRVSGSEVVPDPYPEVRLRYERRAGSWTCTGLLLLSSVPLTRQEISERLPFARLAAEGAEALATLTDTAPPRITAPRRRGRRGHGDEFLEQVAALYRFALLHPEHARAPVAYIRTREELWTQGHEPAEDTVRYWVRKARERGLLGASIPGKAGEA